MKCFLATVLVSLLALEVRGSGYVDVHALVFRNDDGLDQNEDTCESILHIFKEYCDHKFTFCLLDGDSCSTTFHTGTYWDTTTVDFGDPMAGGDANPMRFHFHGYPDQFSLKVVVIDDDNGLTADDPVDTFIVHQTLSSTSPTKKATFTGQRQTKPTTLDLSFTVHCDPNFYGARCSVYCQDTNSESGHYTCGSSGERVCLEGWTNPSQHCLTAVCRDGCKHGSCTQPGDCQCTPGYQGNLCDQPVCDGGCGYGTCTNPGVCSCSEGFRGRHCNEVICREGCKHGSCAQPGDCQCIPGYQGNLCDQPVCDDRCGHGTCTVPGVCSCNDGYKGRICDQAICKDGCIHGNCSTPQECLCHSGYTGELCENAIDVCSNPHICANGGSCTSGGGVGQFECTCPSGYTGERCEELVDNCVSGVCLNGGECVNAHNSFSCRCAEGFTGELCDAEVDHCSPNSCQNDGVCIDIGLDYECVCPVTVDGSESGKNCEGSPCLYHKCENNGTCSVDSSAKAVCACVGAFVGPHCEYVVVNDAVSENDVPLIAGVSAGVGIPLILLVICVPLVAVCVCCRIRRRKKERPESPDRSEQYAVYYDNEEEKVDHCPEKTTTLNYTNQGLDVSDESEDEAGYSTVGRSPLPGVPSTQAYDTLQHIQYSNSGFGGRPKTGTSLDRNGYSVPSRTSTASSRTSTFQGRVSPPPNYTDLPSPLRHTFGGGGSGLPVPEVVEENPYDTPPSVQFVRSEL